MAKKSFSDWLLKFTGLDKAVLNYMSDVLNNQTLDLADLANDEIRYDINKNYVWYKGNVTDLCNFYKNVPTPNSFNGYTNTNFWNFCNRDHRLQKVHIPVASMISSYMSSLIFSQMPRYSIITSNMDKTKLYEQAITDIFEDNDIENLFETGTQLESYSGSIAAKFTIDTNFSNTPVIQLYPAGEFEIREKYGRIFEIVFKDVYEYDKSTYLLKSRYGRGYIKYELYDISNKKKVTQVPLYTIPETSELTDVYIIDQQGKPLNCLLAAYKVNKKCNSVVPNSQQGASDYDGLESVFDEIDLIASLRGTYFRYGSKVKTILTEDQLEKDNEGNVIVKDLVGLDYLIIKDSNPADTQQIRDTVVPNLSQQAYDDAIRSLIGIACDRAGISRTAFGIETAGRNASAEALEIRENQSYKTRARKIKLWSKFIEKLMELSLIFAQVIQTNATKNEEGDSIFTIEADKGISYVVEFPPYEPESDEERATRIKSIEDTGYITHEDAIKLYYEPILEPKQIDAKVKELTNTTPMNGDDIGDI